MRASSQKLSWKIGDPLDDVSGFFISEIKIIALLLIGIEIDVSVTIG